jgi:hypothetical protein
MVIFNKCNPTKKRTKNIYVTNISEREICLHLWLNKLGLASLGQFQDSKNQLSPFKFWAYPERPQ